MPVAGRWSRAAAAAAAGTAALITAFAACARMEPPPGGPPDQAPPRLLVVTPDSAVVSPKFDGEVEFRFDEVITEGGAPSQGTGTGDLERLIILSPSTRVPKVRWRRNRLTVQPAEGWQPNRVYRVELLPGITDLRQNRTDTSVVVTFRTGAAAPTTTLTGTVIDWTTRRPVPNALIIAVLQPDSLPYRSITDSSGKFSLGPLPGGRYVVYGVIDQNRDARQGLREAYDSLALDAAKTDVGELWAFLHDTMPPRIQSTAIDDSLSATFTFSQMLDPTRPFDTSAVRLRRLPDSAAVAIRSLRSKPVDDSLRLAEAPPDTMPADTAGADTLPPQPRPQPQPTPAPRLETPAFTTRPPLFDRLVLRPTEPWVPGGRYVIEIGGVRNVTGTVGTVQHGFSIPEAKPASLADSLQKLLPPDTTQP